MVAGGLVWYHAMIAIIIGHLIGSLLTVWNGRGGSVYHIGVCSQNPVITAEKLTIIVPCVDSSNVRSLGRTHPSRYPLCT